jgi:hypothetical protein
MKGSSFLMPAFPFCRHPLTISGKANQEQISRKWLLLVAAQ